MMTKNSLMKFIDSCVGNIARKIEDEFRESDHPRDKGGKFTSKGNEGYMGVSKEELAEEEEYENARERARREKDDDRVTGPEDRDYMNEEEDDDEGVSLDQYKENVRENFDGDEEYEVEARYDRAKYHSDQFKKLKQGEFYGTPKEKQLKNYYRRLGIKKPEDAFKVWWDI